MVANNAVSFERMRVKTNVMLAVIGLVGALLMTMLGLVRADTEIIRASVNRHVEQHVTGNFQPSRGAQPRATP